MTDTLPLFIYDVLHPSPDIAPVAVPPELAQDDVARMLEAAREEYHALLQDARVLLGPPSPRPMPGSVRMELRWAREKGWMHVRDPLTGEWHEIAFRSAPARWRDALMARSGT